jgi:ribosomal protein S18 acetylase RimI-like enzyme
MKKAITIEYFSDIRDLWPIRDRYMRRDIIPSMPDGEWGDEEEAWFFSKAYYDHFATLFSRDDDPLRCGRLLADGAFAGFFEYVVYASEDGKGFIIEYGIEPDYRGKGIGTACFQLLEQVMQSEGANYLQLNASGERSIGFWQKNGFTFIKKDEHGSDLFEKQF